MVKKIIPYLILLVLVMPLVILILQPGFWVSDDGGWMVIRLSAFHETLRSGQFPVRFLERLNHGFGYPVLNFLYPLPFYLGEIIHLMGFGFVDSVKILFASGFLLGAFFMYRYAGMVAAIVYTYLPYRLFDVYKRGSLGESVAFIFLPLIFYLLDRKKIILAAIATAALITSHNVIAFLFLPVIVVYLITKKTPFIQHSIFYLLAFSLSAFFWLPALYDLQFTRVSNVTVSDFSNYFVTSANLLTLVGVVIILTLILSLKTKSRFFLITTLVSLCLVFPISSPLWQNSPLPKLVQFPWRFLSVVVFSVAVLAGQLPKKAGILLAVLTIVFSAPLLQITRTFQPESYYTTNDDSTTVKNEYMPKWVKVDPLALPASKIEISPDGKTAQVNTVYFPGWQAFVNDKKTPVDYQTNGLIRVNITGVNDKIKIVFTETPIRIIADLMTILGVVLSVIFLCRKKPHSF